MHYSDFPPQKFPAACLPELRYSDFGQIFVPRCGPEGPLWISLGSDAAFLEGLCSNRHNKNNATITKRKPTLQTNDGSVVKFETHTIAMTKPMLLLELWSLVVYLKRRRQK